MKRSKAEELILDYLAEHSIQEISPDEIINLVEKIGMMPPIESNRTMYDLDLGLPEWEEE